VSQEHWSRPATKDITIDAKRLRARSTGRTVLKWHLTLIREYNEAGQGSSS